MAIQLLADLVSNGIEDPKAFLTEQAERDLVTIIRYHQKNIQGPLPVEVNWLGSDYEYDASFYSGILSLWVSATEKALTPGKESAMHEPIGHDWELYKQNEAGLLASSINEIFYDGTNGFIGLRLDTGYMSAIQLPHRKNPEDTVGLYFRAPQGTWYYLAPPSLRNGKYEYIVDNTKLNPREGGREFILAMDPFANI